VTIREASPSDLPSISRLIRELHPEQAGKFDPSAVRQGHRTFVAERDGDVVGVLLGTFTAHGLEYESAGHLEQLIVAPDVRGQGVGEALVYQWTEWLVAEGVSIGFVSTTEELGAASFYERCGFVRCTGPFLVWPQTEAHPGDPAP
jgi:N-acetylglutamate synthase-like GNAT family acetyltransferase